MLLGVWGSWVPGLGSPCTYMMFYRAYYKAAQGAYDVHAMCTYTTNHKEDHRRPYAVIHKNAKCTYKRIYTR